MYIDDWASSTPGLQAQIDHNECHSAEKLLYLGSIDLE